jgi:hypothetical protein
VFCPLGSSLGFGVLTVLKLSSRPRLCCSFVCLPYSVPCLVPDSSSLIVAARYRGLTAGSEQPTTNAHPERRRLYRVDATFHSTPATVTGTGSSTRADPLTSRTTLGCGSSSHSTGRKHSTVVPSRGKLTHAPRTRPHADHYCRFSEHDPLTPNASEQQLRITDAQKAFVIWIIVWPLIGAAIGYHAAGHRGFSRVSGIVSGAYWDVWHRCFILMIGCLSRIEACLNRWSAE